MLSTTTGEPPADDVELAGGPVAPIEPVEPSRLQVTFVPSDGVPASGAFALWGTHDLAATAASLGLPAGEGTIVRLVVPADGGPLAERDVDARLVPVLPMVRVLAAMPTRAGWPAWRRPSDALSAWSLASKLALEFVAEGNLLPYVRPGVRAGTAVGSWRAVPGADPRVDALAEAMPTAAHGLARRDGEPWEARDLLLAFLDAVADVCGRGGRRPGTDGRGRTPRRPWVESWTEALSGPDPVVGNLPFRPADVAADVAAWAAPALERRTSSRARLGLRLRTPETPAATGGEPSVAGADDGAWRVDLELEAVLDPSLVVSAAAVWDEPSGVVELDEENRIEDAHEVLAAGLDTAAQAYEPLRRALRLTRPEWLAVDVDEAAELLAVADELADAGIALHLPPELDALGTGRLRLRLVVGEDRTEYDDPLERGRVEAEPLGARRLSDFRYEIALGEDRISAEEFAQIVGVKRPIIRWRDQWIRLDAAEVQRIEKLAGKEGELSFADALAAALGGFWDDGDGTVEVVARGEVEAFVERLRSAEAPGEPFLQGIVADLRPYQERGIAWLQAMDRLGLGAVLADQMGLGKAQPLDAKVLTPGGWTTMGDLRVGDQVIGSDGRPTTVTGVYDRGERHVYRATFSDGSSTECCDEHLWAVRTAQQRFDDSPGRVLELAQIRADLTDRNGNRRHFVPMVAPVQHPQAELPLDPYLLGVLLGDGAIGHRVMFSTADAEIVDLVAAALPDGVRVTHAGGYDYRIASPGPGRPNVVKAILEELGLFGSGSATKFVPAAYLHASVDQRVALLQGLLDTDGHVRPKDNNVEFVSVSPGLAAGVRELVQSLGGTARIREKPTTHRLAYRMSIALPASVRPFRLARKVDVHRPRHKYPPARAFVEVTHVGLRPTRCIAVEAPDRLYVTDDHLVTHNTLQGIGLMTGRSRRKPHLVVCPTSVVGNWEREINRFAPDVPVVRHHGPERVDDPREFLGGQVVVTTYAILRRDVEVLSGVDWDVVIFDEAQQIKNTASKGAKAARELRAGMRVAMTGTPVENRLAELWAILDAVNPGLLGTQRRFTRQFAVPIERWRDEEAATRLRRLVAPFVLRRRKDDADVALSLPPKTELTVSCSLSREQATLYQAAVDDAFGPGGSQLGEGGIGRKGRILRLLTALKQICNHPAHYLGETGPIPGRSGKLLRATEILQEVTDSGERALVFTQFRKMGDLLQRHLAETLELPEVPFLHGGVTLAARDEMVDRFQLHDDAPPILLVSLRAGGTGLNLTRATQVVHFDRWWNPAVEDQATDRVHRIGQTKAVTVHRLVTAGTIEERIAALLESKRDLAESVVGSGEAWLTELGDEELRSLVELNADDVDEEAA